MNFLLAICSVNFLLVFGAPFPDEGGGVSQILFEEYKMTPENKGALIWARHQLPTNSEESPGTKLATDQPSTNFEESRDTKLKNLLRGNFQKSQERHIKKRIQTQLRGNQEEHQPKVLSYHGVELKNHTKLQENAETKFEDKLWTGTREKKQLETEVKEKKREQHIIRDGRGTKFEDRLETIGTEEDQSEPKKEDRDQLKTTQQETQNLNFEEQLEFKMKRKNQHPFEEMGSLENRLEDQFKIKVMKEDRPRNETVDNDQFVEQREIQSLKLDDQPRTKFREKQGLDESPDSSRLLWSRAPSDQVERKPTKDFKISRTLGRTFVNTKHAINGMFGKLGSCTGGHFSGAKRSFKGGPGKVKQTSSNRLEKKGTTLPTPPRGQRVSRSGRPDSPKQRHRFSLGASDTVNPNADFKPSSDGRPSGPKRHGEIVIERSDDYSDKLPPNVDSQIKQGSRASDNGRAQKMPDGRYVPKPGQKVVSSSELWGQRATNMSPAEQNSAFLKVDAIKAAELKKKSGSKQ